MILGDIEERLTRWQGMTGLFDKRLSDRQAVRRYFDSSKGKPVRRRVTLSGHVHLSVFAPPGAGKTTGLVIPSLLTNPDSAVVVDFKSEIAVATARFRQEEFGHRIVMLNPYGVNMKPGQPLHGFKQDTCNPLEFIKRSDETIDDCLDLANTLVFRKGTEPEPHWNDAAEQWIATMATHIVNLQKAKTVNLQGVKTLLTDPGLIQDALNYMRSSDAWDGILARMGHQLSQYKDKELGSVMTTVNRHLNFLNSPACRANTLSSSFDPSDLVRDKMTVYLTISTVSRP